MTNRQDAEHTVLAFYGIRRQERCLEAIYNTGLRWLAELGLEPHIGGSSLSRKLVPFSRLQKAVLKGGFGPLTDLSIHSLAPGCKYPVEGQNFEVNASAEDGWCYLNARSSILSFGDARLHRAAKEILESVQPSYGIGFTRSSLLGPDFYAVGVSSGARRPESLHISQWGHTGMRYQVYNQGLIRDVYPWSFLTAAQLSAQVGAQKLQHWIERDRAHGSLIRMTDEHLLWTVDQEYLADVRSILSDAGRIFDYDRYMADRRTGTPATAEQIVSALLGEQPEGAQIFKVGSAGQMKELSEQDVKQGIGKRNQKN